MEGTAISVPDPKYGEVVGVWIVRHPDPSSGSHQLSGEDVKKWVSKSMSPQVSGPLYSLLYTSTY
jgi:acyl-CoA synthetase (AMP-forming)/AMP-acid ligase II